MRITGSHDLDAPMPHVWAALTDPAILARTLPGALALERVGDDEYRVKVEAGVASIRGVYDGVVALSNQRPPGSYTLRASGSGAPGTIDATCAVTLTEIDGSGTRVTYEADAIVGGTVGGVGQRVLAGVARRTAAQFFAAVDAELRGVPGVPEEVAEVAVGEVFAGRPRAAPAPAGARPYVVGALFGAAIALLGVLVGRRTAQSPGR